ncbi:YeeE/YedE family protein, partial [bacterium]|nr:YeeE/YedE family protein [bacterium]
GIGFGFLLQKGQVTKYNIIMAQLFLTDFTVIKIIFTAIITGMVGVYGMRAYGLVQLHKKPGSIGSSVIGGLIFGVGFAILGYCPGTVSGAVGQGSVDALLGGTLGLLAGAGIYAAIFPRVRDSILNYGDFGDITIPELLKVPPWAGVIGVSTILIIILGIIEALGF